MKNFGILFIFAAVLALGITAVAHNQASAAALGPATAGQCILNFQNFDVDRDDMVSWDEYRMAYDGQLYAGGNIRPSGGTSWVDFMAKDKDANMMLSRSELCVDMESDSTGGIRSR